MVLVAWRVVIVGGGFGGVYAARALAKTLPRHSAKITLVSDNNFMLYSPLLPAVAGGTVEPRHVVVPLREELRGVDVHLGEVTGIDLAERRVDLVSELGEEHSIGYDQIILSLGSVSKTMGIPGVEEHSIGFKTVSEALVLRDRVLRALEVAESLDDPSERREYLTFVFCGGGYTGVEALAELQDLTADVISLYPRCERDGMRWILCEASDRLMTEVPPDLAGFAARELQARGVEIRLSTPVARIEDDAVHLVGGETIRCRTVAWTAGIQAHPLVDQIGVPLDRHGRIVTDRHMAVAGHPGVWAVGDSAAVPDPANPGQACPPTAQHAMRQGALVARNVAAALGTGRSRPFTYKTMGMVVDLGRHQAVAHVLGLKLRGFPAWFVARTYHLAAMPGYSRRLRLSLDWGVDLFFPHDSTTMGRIDRSLVTKIKVPAARGASRPSPGSR
jgi:NADH dehydrogenase